MPDPVGVPTSPRMQDTWDSGCSDPFPKWAVEQEDDVIHVVVALVTLVCFRHT